MTNERPVDAYRDDYCTGCQTAPIERDGLCRFCQPEETSA